MVIFMVCVSTYMFAVSGEPNTIIYNNIYLYATVGGLLLEAAEEWTNQVADV